jgi:hypothetical protein
MFEPAQIRTAIETLLGVNRDNTGKVTNYGYLGKYVYSNGFQNTAFTAGVTPGGVSKIDGLEFILPFPSVDKIKPIADFAYSEQDYRLTIVARSGATSYGYSAVLILQRSLIFDAFSYTFFDANPEIGNFPQWNCRFKQFVLRERYY